MGRRPGFTLAPCPKRGCDANRICIDRALDVSRKAATFEQKKLCWCTQNLRQDSSLTVAQAPLATFDPAQEGLADSYLVGQLLKGQTQPFTSAFD